MDFLFAPFYLFDGARLCLSDRTIRKLAMKPWIIALLAYLVFGTFAFFAHSPLANWMHLGGSKHSGLENYFWYVLNIIVQFGLIAGLLVLVSLLSFITALVLGGQYHSAIAEHILRENELALPEPSTGVRAIAKSVSTESRSIVFTLVLGGLAFLFSLFPLTALLGFLLASWLFAFECMQSVLEKFEYSFGSRLALGIRYGLTYTLYGAIITLFGLIPFAGLLLPPIAVAGAASLVAGTSIRQRLPGQ